MKKFLFIIISAFVLFSCKTKKLAETESNKDSVFVNNPKDVNKSYDADYYFYEKIILPVKFNHIKISSKINIETEKNYIPTLDATTYISNNEQVWMNLQAFLINVARGVATPDGIKGYVRTQKTYIDSDFEYLNNLLNTNFIHYKSLEKLLMGRTFIRITESGFHLTRNSSGYKMVSLYNQKIENNGSLREYKIEINYAKNLDLKNIYFKDVNSIDELEVSYDNWEDFSTYRMPKNVKITIKGSKNTTISIENTKFDETEMKTPFSIPSSYTKIEIQ